MALWYKIDNDEIWFCYYKRGDDYTEWAPPISYDTSPTMGKSVNVVGQAVGVILDLPENSQYLFAGCTSFNPINWRTNAAINMSGLFQGSTVSVLDLSNWNTSNVTDMSNMFRDCPNLTAINMLSFNTQNVTTMQAMFYGFKGTILNLVSFKTPNLVNTSQMFYMCSNLKTIVTREFTNEQIIDFASMFTGCTRLVGGNGTVYRYADKTYARIDNAPTVPGYFSPEYHWVEYESYIKINDSWVKAEVFR